MSKFVRDQAIALGAVLAVAALAAPLARADYDLPAEQWEVAAYGSDYLENEETIRLRNVDTESYVVYGEREYGINLIWRDSSAREWVIFDAPGTGTPYHDMHYGERFALYNASAGSYVKYGWREYGINLLWSEDPVYEWSFEGHDGAAPLGGDRRVWWTDHVALYNHNLDEYVAYGEREYGIDLDWLDTIHGDYAN